MLSWKKNVENSQKNVRNKKNFSILRLELCSYANKNLSKATAFYPDLISVRVLKLSKSFAKGRKSYFYS